MCEIFKVIFPKTDRHGKEDAINWNIKLVNHWKWIGGEHTNNISETGVILWEETCIMKVLPRCNHKQDVSLNIIQI